MESIIKKYLEGKCSAEEQETLLQWMRSEGNLSEFQRIKKDWQEEVKDKALPAWLSPDWNSIQNKMVENLQQEARQKQRALNFFRYAAIFMVLAALPSLLYLLTKKTTFAPLAYTTVTADYGQISKVELPDGSVVWVNSGSKIKYNNRFASANRDIELVGEAFFQVKKNAELPLIVSSSVLKVKVLGTEFSVSAYPEEANVQVVLEKGKVELTATSDSQIRKEMKPGELASFNIGQNKLSIEPVNTDLYTSWKDGLINIYNLPLSELVIRLEKRYNQKFVVDDAIKNLPYTFTIKNEDLSSILSLMEKITPVDAIQNGNVIELKHHRTKGHRVN